MAGKHLMITLCALALSSLTSVNGKYRISWITSAETNSGTNHWVGFEAFKADGKTKTEWMWPNSYFDRGYYGSAEVDEPSIGDIAKVNVHIQKKWGQAHQDDWRGYQVVISDFKTKKAYEFFPGHVDTGGYQKYNVREVVCEDKTSNVQKYCNPKGNHCGTTSNPSGAFNMAKFDFLKCLKTCNFCYPPDSDEPEDEEAREDEEPSGDDSSADHEKKSTHHKKN